MPKPDAFASFRLDPAPPPVLVRASANEVWRGRRDGREVYVRLTGATHRSKDEVRAEIAWMQSLAAAGVRVVRPLASSSGDVVEDATMDGAPAFAVAFAAAPGRPCEKPRDLETQTVERWAALQAELHAHARTYVAGPARRAAWHEDRVLEVALAAREPETAPAQRRLRELAAWMRTLPTDADGFGLTHADLHLGNLAVDDGGALTAFDFDDAIYQWFVHDVAVAVTSLRKAAWECPDVPGVTALEARYLDAYARAAGATRLEHLERFVAYRIALSACWASRQLTQGALDEGMIAWYRRSLPWWLERLS